MRSSQPLIESSHEPHLIGLSIAVWRRGRVRRRVRQLQAHLGQQDWSEKSTSRPVTPNHAPDHPTKTFWTETIAVVTLTMSQCRRFRQPKTNPTRILPAKASHSEAVTLA